MKATVRSDDMAFFAGTCWHRLRSDGLSGCGSVERSLTSEPVMAGALPDVPMCGKSGCFHYRRVFFGGSSA